MLALSMRSMTEVQHCVANGLAHLSSVMPARMSEILSSVARLYGAFSSMAFFA